jgi:hypothetical protein
MDFQSDLSDIPEEVTDYAFDQYRDRLSMNLDELANEALANEYADLDYENQTVKLRGTILTTALQNAMLEKVQDMQREVSSGERNDYTERELQHINERVWEAFD